MNKVILLGNLGTDPEVKFMQSGTAMCRLRLATSEKWKDKATGDLQEKTEWHTVVIWGKRAEALGGMLQKGEKVCIEGRLVYNEWEDRDGNKRIRAEIKAFDVHLLGGRQGGGPRDGYGTRGKVSGGDFGGADFSDDDVPFAKRDDRIF